MLPCCPIDKTKRWCLKADKAEHNLVAVRSRILPTLLYPFHRDVGKILLVVAADDNRVSSMLHRRILPIRSLSWRFHLCLCKWFAYCRPTRNNCGLLLFDGNWYSYGFLLCFSQNLPTPHKFPFNPTRRTRAYAYIRARALTEFAIFAFTLHLTPQQAVDQPLECKGKPCLHPHRNNLNFNTLHDIDCKKQVKAKGWNLHP